MGRKRKQLIDFKPLKSVKYQKELHHTCTNPIICREYSQPCNSCEGCRHYKLREVDVVENKIRYDINWF